MALVWGDAKFYADYYKLLLTQQGRWEFLRWLEAEQPALHAQLLKRIEGAKR